jgi:hypothetical protein
VAGLTVVADRGGRVYRAYGSLGEVLVLFCPDWHIGLVAAATDGDAVLVCLAQALAGMREQRGAARDRLAAGV